MSRPLCRIVLIAGLALAAGISAATQPGTKLTFIVGSTAKVEQLIGDLDKQRNAPTASQTLTRYGIEGTDLGYSFEHNGQVLFLFGDTIGNAGPRGGRGRRGAAAGGGVGGGDPIGVTRATDPERGVKMDFLPGSDGSYLRVRPEGVAMGGFEVPVSGISLDDKLYVVVKTNHSETSPTDRSLLTRFDEGKRTFKVLRTISQLPEGRVIKMSMHEAPGSIDGLPPGGPSILIWSSGIYRSSDAYLSVVPRKDFESGKGTRYFSGLGANGAPTWSEREKDAQAIVEEGAIGDLSVTWVAPLKMWVMTYDGRGVHFRYSATPWGPWSADQMIFSVQRDGGRAFIHSAGREDGLIGPIIARGRGSALELNGGAYAPYVIERFTKVQDGKLSIYYVLSTWNPYVVVLMRSMFSVSGS
jgi:uncharacterized protein DUF4185